MNASEFERHFDSVLQSVASVEGHLSDCEIRCLLLLGSVPTSRGVVLEIGSFRGRSTIILAKAAALAGEARIVAVDPLTLPANSDPGLLGHTDGWNEFQANLKSAGVESLVEFYREFSSHLAGKWPKERGIRLL